MSDSLKKEYRDLETKVFAQLREKISKSKHISKHIIGLRVLPVNLFDYTELAVINDRLTFMNNDGYHYSIFADAGLEDLIDILK